MKLVIVATLVGLAVALVLIMRWLTSDAFMVCIRAEDCRD